MPALTPMWPKRVSVSRNGDQEVDALFENGLGKSGILLLAGDLRETVGDLAGSWAGREVSEIGDTTLGLRDDRAGDTDHVVCVEIRSL